ncbi:MAG: hypothetical protein Kow0042_15820 [Calditrichia bacterium]
MEANFNLKSRLEGEILIIDTEGYVNNEGGEKILQEFERHFARGIKKVVINLEQSKVVNSIGISYLIEVIEKLNENGGKLVFTNLTPAIEKTLTIMGLFTYAENQPTVGEALNALQG